LDPFHEKRNLSDIHENILFKSFINSPKKLHERVDLSIIHGGRGTVYTVAYSGKPAIGFPHYMEHQYNLDNLVSHGTTIRLSKRNFSPEKLLETIHQMFAHYEYYLQNAQQLSAKLTPIAGEQNAVAVIKQIINQDLKKP
jgi:UDP:flavonoid glycosyltransferase YjiC (YdhE family)